LTGQDRRRSWSLTDFGVDEFTAYSAEARLLGRGANSMEEAAARIVRSLFDDFEDGSGRPGFALVRLYKTHAKGALPADLRSFADQAAGETLTDDVRCLTLLGTVGDVPEWCDRRRSQGHQAIPLVSPEAVAGLPMVARLVESLGLAATDVTTPPTAVDALELHHRRYDVFHVEDASGSPWVPAQDFVRTHGIGSVIGCGGVLPSGDLFAVIGFARVRVSGQVADLFSSVALAFKAALIPFSYRVFAEP
jgi:hypothetical protein